jgi:hypothetical protein
MERTVRFLVNRDVFNPEGIIQQAFVAGSSYKMTDASANRWVRRGVAVDVEPEPVSMAKKAAAKKKTFGTRAKG